MVFRHGQLNKARVFSFKEPIVIPTGSVLHVTNGLEMDGAITPNLDEILRFTGGGGLIRLVFNDFVTPQYKTFANTDKTIREVSAGIRSSQDRFKTDNAGKVLVYKTLEAAHEIMLDKFTVCSHAANRQLRITGVQKALRFYEYFFSAIFDCVASSDVDAQHFLPIRLVNLYRRTDFNPILMRGKTISTVQFPDDPVYILIANMMLWFKKTNHKHIFEKYQTDSFAKLNLILHTDTRFICINFNDLLGFIGGDNAVADRTFNLLEEIHTTAEVSDVDSADEDSDVQTTTTASAVTEDPEENKPIYENKPVDVAKSPAKQPDKKSLYPRFLPVQTGLADLVETAQGCATTREDYHGTYYFFGPSSGWLSGR